VSYDLLDDTPELREIKRSAGATRDVIAVAS
jgi:hypothetical protein